MTNCSCPYHFSGFALGAATNTVASDTQRASDQTPTGSSPLHITSYCLANQASTSNHQQEADDLATLVSPECNAAVHALLNGTGKLLKTSAAKAASVSPSLTEQPLSATTQPLTPESAQHLHSNNYFVIALQKMKNDASVAKILQDLKETHPLLEGSLQRFLKAAFAPKDVFSNHTKNSTAWLTDLNANLFKEHLFKLMHVESKQSEMQLIDIATLPQDSSELIGRLKVFLDKTGLSSDDQNQTIGLPRLAGSDKGRNTLFLELQPLVDNGSEKSKPIRLFFASGTRPMPRALFETTINDGEPRSEFRILNDETVSESVSPDCKESIAREIQNAQSEEAVLAIDYSVLKRLGIGKPDGPKEIPRMPDTSQVQGSTGKPRTDDTEHMALSFLLKMATALGLNPAEEENQPVKYRLDVFSRRPICRSCHLGLAFAVTNDKFPRLNEFNIVYGTQTKPPKPHESLSVADVGPSIST